MARGGSSETTRISKFEAKRRATVLYISITLSDAIDLEDPMVSCWKGVWVMVFHGNSEDPRIWQDLNDHFSSNSQHRCEHIYMKVRIFLKDHARTLRFR